INATLESPKCCVYSDVSWKTLSSKKAAQDRKKLEGEAFSQVKRKLLFDESNEKTTSPQPKRAHIA
ncbi:MAG TPA: hypothetical protein VJ201_06035, partial [Candidatus Babeliales bacterium]|nr:hypothetical protein [Candidatus Babeliales bacterium]